jgi:hypothetical protein
MRLTIIE